MTGAEALAELSADGMMVLDAELLLYQAGKWLGAGALQPFRWPLANAMPARQWVAEDCAVLDGDLRQRWIRTDSA